MTMHDSSRLVVGLMSGTSMDGIDAALVRIGTGPEEIETVSTFFQGYSTRTRDYLLGLLHTDASIDDLCLANSLLGRLNGEAVLKLLESAEVGSGEVTAIGYHGQTIRHLPDETDVCGVRVRATLQIGDAATVAHIAGIPVVNNFRARDMAAGGQGAPLLPAFDHFVLTHAKIGTVALNLGGIANVTFLPPAVPRGEVIAFDTGPGNCLIDSAVAALSGGSTHLDEGGSQAMEGTVDEAVLDDLLSMPYFRLPPPKSTGRSLFNAELAQSVVWRIPQAKDCLATLTALSARSIAGAIRSFWPVSNPPRRVIASGGGVHNEALMQMLGQHLGAAEVITSDQLGIDPDFKEAIAFAWLADRTMQHLPGNLPSATGAERPVILGNITPA